MTCTGVFIFNVCIDFGDLATWITGIATLALIIIGFIQINIERTLRIKRERDIEKRTKRRQAELISSWIVTEDLYQNNYQIWISVLNQSNQPIYQVIVSLVELSNSPKFEGFPSSFREFIDIVPPGQGYVAINFAGGGMHHHVGVEIAFKDVAGNNWLRKAIGELIEIENSPLEYYQIALPTGWVRIKKDIPIPNIL